MPKSPCYQRILLKLSGEALMGAQKFGIDLAASDKIVADVVELGRIGVQVGVVIGGGNIFRGVKMHDAGLARTPADHIGMLSTIINGIALQQSFEKQNCKSRIMSAIACPGIVDSYIWKDAIEELKKGTVLIFVGGTGNPYFTTDSAAALRAVEIHAEILIKATKVDGIYNKDPVKYPEAKKFDRITYSDVLTKQLGVMDAAAIAICRENHLPIRVIDMFSDSALKKAVCNEPVGTLVEEGEG